MNIDQLIFSGYSKNVWSGWFLISRKSEYWKGKFDWVSNVDTLGLENDINSMCISS